DRAGAPGHFIRGAVAGIRVKPEDLGGMAVEIEQPARVLPDSTREEFFVQLQKSFKTQEQEFLLDVDFSVPAGITIVFGASGAGKTTLLNCIAGLTKPDRGTIRACGRELFGREINISVRHRKIG